MERISRRKVLAAGSAALVGGLAGCNEDVTEGSDSADRLDSVAWPIVSASMGDWEQVGTEQQYRGMIGGSNVYTKTRVWEDAELRRDVKEMTLDQFDQPLAQFFATLVDLRGPTAGLATTEMIADEVEEGFRDRLAESGIQEIAEVSVGDPRPDLNAEAELREFEGHYETPELERTADIDGVGERSIVFESTELPIRAPLAVWKTKRGRAFAAGGAFPTEDYEGTTRSSLTGREGEGIDLIVDVDLGIRPAPIRRDVVSFAENVTAGPTDLGEIDGATATAENTETSERNETTAGTGAETADT